MFEKIKVFDKNIIAYIDNKFSCKTMDKIMKVVTFVGDYGLVWASLIIYLFVKGKTLEGLALLCSLGTTSLLNEKILKKIFKRTRPANEFDYKNLVIKIPTSYSFPSGHTATAFSVVPLAMSFGSVLGILSIVVASIIGFSRVYLKVHYLTDVLVGSVIGTSMSIITYLIIFI